MKFIQINQEAQIAPIQKKPTQSNKIFENFYQSLLNCIKIIYNKSLTVEEIAAMSGITKSTALRYMKQLRANKFLLSQKQGHRGKVKYTCTVNFIDREFFYRRIANISEEKILKLMQESAIGRFYTMEDKKLLQKYKEQAALQTKEIKKKIVASNMQSSFSLV